MVSNLEAAWKLKKHNKKAILGFIFIIIVHYCCLENGEIVKYVTPQYALRSCGWNHTCGQIGKSIYLNDSCLCTNCSGNDDHPKTTVYPYSIYCVGSCHFVTFVFGNTYVQTNI